VIQDEFEKGVLGSREAWWIAFWGEEGRLV
jgi:hypothetical protein